MKWFKRQPVFTSHYTMVIRWSEEDGCYGVYLPEWRDALINGEGPVADGKTFAEAAKRGQGMLEELMYVFQQNGTPLPPVASAVA